MSEEKSLDQLKKEAAEKAKELARKRLEEKNMQAQQEASNDSTPPKENNSNESKPTKDDNKDNIDLAKAKAAAAAKAKAAALAKMKEKEQETTRDETPTIENQTEKEESIDVTKAKAAAAAKAKAAALAKMKAKEQAAKAEGEEPGSATDTDDLAKQKAIAAAKAKAAAAAKAKAAALAKAGGEDVDSEKAKAIAAAKAKAAAAAKAKAAAQSKAGGADVDLEKAKAIAAAKAKAAALAKAKAGANSDSDLGETDSEKPSIKQPLLDKYVEVIREHLGEDVLEDSYINRLSKDVPTLVAKAETYFKVAEFLKYNEKLGFDYLSELHGTDFETHFEVYLHLYSFKNKQEVALKVKINRDEPTIPSVTPLWAGANWPECETYDLLGIEFTGHPNLHRIFLGEDWVGHPLRKDYEPYDVEV